jgi:hypothetical protein
MLIKLNRNTSQSLQAKEYLAHSLMLNLQTDLARLAGKGYLNSKKMNKDGTALAITAKR